MAAPRLASRGDGRVDVGGIEVDGSVIRTAAGDRTAVLVAAAGGSATSTGEG